MNEKNPSTHLLDNFDVLIEEKRKITEMNVKNISALSTFITLFCYIGILLLNKNFQSSTYLNPITLFLQLLLINLIYIICIYINSDDRLIQKYKLNIHHNIDIYKVKSLHIFRTAPTKFFIVDENNNLLYKLRYKNFKYFIIDSNDIKQGEINIGILGEYIVKLIDEKPYSVRHKLQFAHNYSVVGRSYIVKREGQGITNVIYNLNGEKQAIITATTTKNNRWAILGSTKVTLVNSSNLDLALISFCITDGNLHHYQN